MMTDNVENIVLEQLRALRNDVKAQREELLQGFRDVSMRLSSLELHQSANSMDSTRATARLDELVTRIERLETRLELA
jgi:uncharacterized protein (UPF0335 family)